jgi:hypothetical protein
MYDLRIVILYIVEKPLGRRKLREGSLVSPGNELGYGYVWTRRCLELFD